MTDPPGLLAAEHVSAYLFLCMRNGSLFLVLGVVACAHPQPQAQPATSAQTATPTGRPGPSAQVVNATILANGCQVFGRANAQLAESAMYHLVEGCSSVPGGSAQFVASLEPGGRIAITGSPGQPDVVPICILKHSLQHKVALVKPCRLDVKIEQSNVPLFVDGGRP